jgi:ankyrin repeat protein
VQDPNEGKMIGASPLLLATMQGQFDTARALIAKGADVKALDGAGSTTLMWATANEAGAPEFVKELIDLGVDPKIKNKAGDDALTWAMRRGYTPVVEILRQNGASTSPMIRASVEKAIALLQKSGPQFSKGFHMCVLPSSVAAANGVCPCPRTRVRSGRGCLRTAGESRWSPCTGR